MMEILDEIEIYYSDDIGLMCFAKPLAGDYTSIKYVRADKQLDPNMPTQELLLHMGELKEDEILVARAAIAWANNHLNTTNK